MVWGVAADGLGLSGASGLDGAEGNRGSMGVGSAQEEDVGTWPRSPRCPGSEVTSGGLLAQPGASGRVCGKHFRGNERCGCGGHPTGPAPARAREEPWGGEDGRDAGVPVQASQSPRGAWRGLHTRAPSGPAEPQATPLPAVIKSSGIRKLSRLFKIGRAHV